MRDLFGVETELLPSPVQRAYRNRMDFVVDGQTVGLRPAGDFSQYINIENCAIQSDVANSILSASQSLLAQNPEAAFKRASPDSSGALKYITIRAAEDETMVVLTCERSRQLSVPYISFKESLIERLAAMPDLSIVECYSDHPAEVSCTPGGRALRGKESLQMKIALKNAPDLSVQIPYDGFFQPNTSAFGALLAELQARLEPHLRHISGGLMLDLFCGSGTLALFFSQAFPGKFTQIIGHEFSASAIAPAGQNFSDITAHFYETDLQNATGLSARADFIILDPPRAGISPALQAYLNLMRAPVLYISCNPATQIRDMQAMDQYLVSFALQLDQFPWTPHLEQAALLLPR
jgi:23S rRNA (uracil1939-C5)-methyltransferase